ncbi:MAG: hypothetical protein JWN76_159 [Chitinophagaceae bacterium]|nr:hypothetical protein [Chitinophagaceae bacterium]
MRSLTSFIFFYFCLIVAHAQLPKILAETTIEYSISFNKADSVTNRPDATRIVYIKGKQARADFISRNFTQSIITDNTDTTAVILKQVGNEKYITRLNGDRWKQMNQRFQALTISPSSETKKILGYDCKKWVIHLKDGSSFTVFCATTLKPSTVDNPFQFKNLPGLVMEYDAENGAAAMKYVATQISFDPVPASKFELPKKGYKILD